MYSDKENVNILTALLVSHGVRHAVVCPGSRNAPIVHNLTQCSDIRCYAVTDERSAGFYALGMSQAKGRVAVCVTSGTALLNLAPAVAEAYYQQRPLVVISADRPPQWIDQQDGQTLPQGDALGRFVHRAVTLPEPHDAETRWYCNRLVNEALGEWRGPVHINVPISEPLFGFTTPALPAERTITFTPAAMSACEQDRILSRFMQAERPMLVSGQPWNALMDQAVIAIADDARYRPDFVLYTGGAIVSKRLKHLLREAQEAWVVNNTGQATDTFMNLTHVFQGDGSMVASQVRIALQQRPHPFCTLWAELLADVGRRARAYSPAYSQMAAVRCLEQHFAARHVESAEPFAVHYANSMAVRLANIYSSSPFFCNRGVNGIEGSLSTAAGMSCVSEGPVFCVVGDLSFFYDQNALWCRHLRGNFRVLLLNNGGGAIFRLLPGLEQSAARDGYVAACHSTQAEGICRQYGVAYRRACSMESMQQGIDWLVRTEGSCPLLLEVVTDAAADERAYRQFQQSFRCLKADG